VKLSQSENANTKPAMLIMFAVPLVMLAAVAFPPFLSRVAVLAVIAIVVGLTWRAAMIGSVDLMLVMGGAALARRFGFPKQVSVIRARRIAVAFMGFIFLEFGAFAVVVTNYTGDATYALPFDLGMLLSGVTLALLLSRRQGQIVPRNVSGISLISESPKASLRCA